MEGAPIFYHAERTGLKWSSVKRLVLAFVILDKTRACFSLATDLCKFHAKIFFTIMN